MKTTPKTANEGENITIKDETKHNFIVVYDTIYKRNDFTSDEIHLLIKLISMAPTFKPTKRKMMSILNIGESSLLKAMKGLQEKGFLKIKKYGRSSEWIITQNPTIDKIKDLKTDSIVNALLDLIITLKDVKELHRRKLIDDKQFIEICDQFAEGIRRINKTQWLNND